jgi:hypothetical protein
MTRVEIRPDTARALLARFGDFHDAVIRSVELRPEAWTGRLVVDAQDLGDAEKWVRVTFDLDGLKEWRLEQGRADMVVIFEVRLGFDDHLVFLGLDGPSEGDATAGAFRAGGVYLAAERVRVSF